MTEEQIVKLIQDTLKAQQQDLETTVVNLLAPTVESFKQELAGRLEAVEKAGSTAKPKDKAESAMEQRIRGLEEQLKAAEEARANQEKASASLRFDQELSKTLDGTSPLHKGIVQELLATRLKQDAVEKDGVWLTKDGKTLAESTKGFFETPEGQHFLPSSHQNGAGTSEPKGNKTAPAGTSLADELASAFLA